MLTCKKTLNQPTFSIISSQLPSSSIISPHFPPTCKLTYVNQVFDLYFSYLIFLLFLRLKLGQPDPTHPALFYFHLGWQIFSINNKIMTNFAGFDLLGSDFLKYCYPTYAQYPRKLVGRNKPFSHILPSILLLYSYYLPYF